ncbi:MULTISPECIES: WhiB family transcriptional regulator [unclassified Blastococcus]
MPSFSRSHLSLISESTAPEYGYAGFDTAEPPAGADLFAGYDAFAAAGQLPAASWDDAGEEPWRMDALCAETDPEAFFPEKGGSTREAKRVCGGCTVRAECLEFALANDERFGIWGGLSERERRRLKLQRRGALSA